MLKCVAPKWTHPQGVAVIVYIQLDKIRYLTIILIVFCCHFYQV